MPSITEISSSEPKPKLDARPTTEWLAEYGPKIDNLRAALDWAFSPDGDTQIGVALTAAAVPVWMQLSLLEECRRRVEQALAALATVAEPDARQEMKLLAALGASRLYTRGGVPEVASAWTKALELAESLGDLEYQKRSLWGLWSFHVNGVDYRTALSLAHRFASLVATSLDRNDRFVGERMIGISHHNLGDQQSARRHIERALAELRCSRPRTAIHSPAARPAGYGPRPSCANSLAAGLSGSRDARGRT